MNARVIVASAAELSPVEFLSAVTGRPIRVRDRAKEAAYLEFINAHHAAAKAESDAMVKGEGETVMDFLIRKLAPLYAHDAWEREQTNLWVSDRWEAPVADIAEAA